MTTASTLFEYHVPDNFDMESHLCLLTPLHGTGRSIPDPPEDLLGVAALILTGSYNGQEFVRVWYHQNTKYDDEMLKESALKAVVERLTRDNRMRPVRKQSEKLSI